MKTNQRLQLIDFKRIQNDKWLIEFIAAYTYTYGF